MRIEDSAIYYEVRDYFIEIFCPIFSFKDNEDKIISANVKCSLSEIENVVFEIVKKNGYFKKTTFLDDITYRIYIVKNENVKKKKAIKYKIVKTKVVSKYKYVDDVEEKHIYISSGKVDLSDKFFN